MIPVSSRTATDLPALTESRLRQRGSRIGAGVRPPGRERARAGRLPRGFIADVLSQCVADELGHGPILTSCLPFQARLEVGLEVDGRTFHMLMLAYMLTYHRRLPAARCQI